METTTKTKIVEEIQLIGTIAERSEAWDYCATNGYHVTYVGPDNTVMPVDFNKFKIIAQRTTIAQRGYQP